MWETIIIQPFTNLLLLINSLVHNFGVSIIIFTLLIRLLTHPLTARQFQSSQKMQDLQEDPRYKKIQEKYKDDKDRLAQEQMKLYQEKGINPMGSCLPTLIQFPIMLGLYQSVMKAMAASPYEMFQLEQIIYPKWLNVANVLPLENRFLWMDLGQPERLQIFGLSIPFLAIIVVITTFLQSKLIQPPSQGNDQAAMVTNSMNLYMPILMGFMAYSLASGLSIYFLTSNIFGIIQYSILGRADWKNVLPFLKKEEPEKDSKKKQKAAAVTLPDVDDDEEEEPIRSTTSSRKSSSKRQNLPKKQRPKRKK